jgi:rod shape-determining protein MreC
MPEKKTLSTLIALTIIVILLIIGQRTHILTPLNNGITTLLSPLSKMSYWLGGIISPNNNENKTFNEIQDELYSLTVENQKLLSENVKISQVEQENKELRDLLHFYNTQPSDFVVSNVIALGSSSSITQQHTISLDRGGNDGIKMGMPIVNNQGILLGKIITVEPTISQACLLFDDICRLAVTIQGQSETIGVIQSDLSLTLKIGFIPHSQHIEEGQLIISSGLEEGMPPGLVIGKISRVIKEGNELWQHALVEPIANFNDIKIISVIK